MANQDVIGFEQLTELVERIYCAVGVSPDDAAVVAKHQVGANLAGHDSHGVRLLPAYLDRIKVGHIVPDARPEIVAEQATRARIDGSWGFGQTTTTFAMDLCITKAKESGLAAVTVKRQGHVGRLSDYAVMASRQGLFGFICCDSGQTFKAVAPFGGSDARLGTNPLCMSFPSTLAAPIVIDMATSAVAGGKLADAESRGVRIPLGWLLDAKGRPTTDPGAIEHGGVMLPLGGAEGHKGYALSFAVETLAAVLTGLGFGVDPSGRHNDGAFMFAFEVDFFSPLAQFMAEVEGFCRFLKESPPAEGFTEVLYPGEMEYRTEQLRRRNGIPLASLGWQRLSATARDLGLEHLLPT